MYREQNETYENEYAETPELNEYAEGELNEYGEQNEYGELNEYGETNEQGEYGENEYGENEQGEGEYAESGYGEIAQESLLAAELLEVRTEQELDRFLGGLFKKIGRGVKSFARSGVGKSLIGGLKGVAKTMLPMAGSALGNMILPGIGGAVGGKLAGWAGSALGLEIGGMRNEEAHFELARRYARVARSAGKNGLAMARGAQRRYGRVSPGRARAISRQALVKALRRSAPGLLRGGPPPRPGAQAPMGAPQGALGGYGAPQAPGGYGAPQGAPQGDASAGAEGGEPGGYGDPAAFGGPQGGYGSPDDAAYGAPAPHVCTCGAGGAEAPPSAEWEVGDRPGTVQVRPPPGRPQSGRWVRQGSRIILSL